MTLALTRAQQTAVGGRPTAGDGRLTNKIEGALPFALTKAQTTAIADIRADIASDKRMLRLLQGDVGSGKTIVALMAAGIVAEAGRQAALMAPTEVLARQLHETIAPLADAAGLRCALLTGREKGRPRASLLSDLASGHIDLLIGTHAVIQPDVIFRDLALAIVDEQHRFGVEQRLALSERARRPTSC